MAILGLQGVRGGVGTISYRGAGVVITAFR